MVFPERITIGDSLVITVFSMLLVFAALVVLSFIIDAFKLLANRQEKKATSTVSSKGVENKDDKPVIMPIIENVSSQEEDDLELVAVITASIAAMLSKPASNIVVRNIVRVPQTTPIWGSVSRQEIIKNNINIK